ncbi:hypothetical protein [Micromonospora sp. WMMD812]|uniref:hypothetical protein n=1 Tax=Micromonospora sp. WMMD812 TaxID=3015152 RepID=UPI00248C1B0C|nr:hypothetical protein [Micromonospora sp. WMMD812]WBB65709.1 hypothetical protein O7603_21225 [Micromonospora sp. WMMD812]
MARRGWGGSIATAIGVAAGTGAAQLGFGYGLGIINWAPADAGVAPAAWVASLIWATWIAATSTILGAVCAHRLRERVPATTPAAAGSDTTTGSGTATPDGADPARPLDATDRESAPLQGTVDDASTGPVAGDRTPARAGGGSRHAGLAHVGLAVAAGLGALVTVLLVGVPARVAEAPDTATPQRVAAAYAAIGVLLGVLSALWALRSRAAAANIIATVAWLWLLAVIAVVDGVLSGRGLTTAQLGIWQISADRPGFWIRDYLYWPGAVLSLGSALVIGVLAARRAARSTDRRVGATISGAAGPLLVALGYLLAVPRLSAISPEQVSAHLIAPYAVIGGIGGSVLVAAFAQRADRRTAAPVPTPQFRPTTGQPATSGPSTGQLATAGPSTGEPKTSTASGRGRLASATKTGTAGDPGPAPAAGASPAADPRVPAPRTGEADRLAPAGTDNSGPATAEAASKQAGRRGRSPRRPE